MSRPSGGIGKRARINDVDVAGIGTHVCKPSWAAEGLLRSGERSSVHLTCSVCLRGTTWISNHLGKVVALPARGEL